MVKLHEITPDVEDLLGSIGFTSIDNTKGMAGIYFDDLVIFDGSHQCLAYDCYNADIFPDELFKEIETRGITYDIDKVEREYGVSAKLFDSVPEMISEELMLV